MLIAAGVLQADDGRVLIAQRRPGTAGAGKWEFPGGKVEPGETNHQALLRELQEELGVRVTAARPLLAFSHNYAARTVHLKLWLVEAWQGRASSNEGQPIRWVRPDQLRDYDLLAANKPIVDSLLLPPFYAITPSGDLSREALIAGALSLLQSPNTLLRLRLPKLADSDYADLVGNLCEQAPDRVHRLLLDRPAVSDVTGGVHLSFAAARASGVRPVADNRWFAVSCHDQEQLAQALALGADFATLSPVLPTASHPGAESLGWAGFARERDEIAMPVYALGGLSRTQLEDSWQAGAQGVAGISGFWPGS